jgi:creatinine amidohydrolase
MKTIKMEEMNWPDIKSALKEGYTKVIIGVGSMEQHGPHLPTITDTLIGDALANRVALKLGQTLQAKTICVGCSEHHLAFPGTISIKADTLKRIMDDYTESLIHHGFRHIIYLPSHGGNFSTVAETVKQQQLKYPEHKIIAYTDLLGFIDWFYEISQEFQITKEEAGAHAGENETSVILALSKDLVQTERFQAGYLGPLGEEEVKTIINEGMPVLSENGVLGDPTKATAEKGEVYLDKMADYLTFWLKENLI